MQKYIEEINMKTSRPPVATDMNPKAMVNSNLKFNEALLKECKSRVKKFILHLEVSIAFKVIVNVLVNDDVVCLVGLKL